MYSVDFFLLPLLALGFAFHPLLGCLWFTLTSRKAQSDTLRTSKSAPGEVRFVADFGGSTGLHYAARKGDVDVPASSEDRFRPVL